MADVEVFDLERYLTDGVARLVRQLTKISNFHTKESLFMAQYAIASKRASALRKQAEANGEHIPAFLIASITSLCNLHCAGCYARSLDSCVDGTPVDQMTGGDWGDVFRQAHELGIGFILLAGGEPLVRKDVIQQAAQCPDILFPIFTNGTMIGEEYIELFDRHRNLIPVLSMEGGQEITDRRRGSGIYQQLQTTMEQMRTRKLVYGISVTVTSENLAEVVSDEFITQMERTGCKAIVYVEFVPTNEGMSSLALNDAAREDLARRVEELRADHNAMLLISFPGDEKKSGGCMAAGRGFFHINSHGGAEPCPFSPYSDVNVRDTSLRDALHSPLFRGLKEQGLLTQEHDGGCVLFQKRQQVEAILQSPVTVD